MANESLRIFEIKVVSDENQNDASDQRTLSSAVLTEAVSFMSS
jgi:hypothetical protein